MRTLYLPRWALIGPGRIIGHIPDFGPDRRRPDGSYRTFCGLVILDSEMRSTGMVAVRSGTLARIGTICKRCRKAGVWDRPGTIG